MGKITAAHGGPETRPKAPSEVNAANATGAIVVAIDQATLRLLAEVDLPDDVGVFAFVFRLVHLHIIAAHRSSPALRCINIFSL